jgi:hypothetical protein
MAFRSPPRKVTYFEPGLAAPRAQHHHRVDVRGRPPLQLHVAMTKPSKLVACRPFRLTRRWREIDSNYSSRHGETPLGAAM